MRLPRTVAAVGIGLLVVLLIAVLPVPSAPAGPASARGIGGPGTLGPGALPAALTTPWAARAGFNATLPAVVPDPSPVGGELSVRLTLWPRDNGLFLPGSTPVSPGEFALRYAPAPSQIAALEGYLNASGLTVTGLSPDHMALTAIGPAPAVGTAFGTTVVTGALHGRTVVFPDQPPALPAPYAADVAAISGLTSGVSTFSLPFARDALPVPASAPAQGRTSNFIYPSALHQVYDLDGLYNYSGSPHWATGIGIAVVLWGEGYSPSDLTNFFQTYYPPGFPAVTVVAQPVNGAPLPSPSAVNDPSGAPQEMTLDLEWAGSAAPGATLHAVYAPDGPPSNNYSPTDVNLEAALSTAVNTAGVDVVSMSFGTPDGSDPSFQAAFTTTLASASARGITVLAASGDTGGTVKADCSGGPSPEFPAASPYVLAVGGTAPVLALNAFGTVTGLDSEPAWNRSGGGYSTDYPAPSWQEVGSAASPISASGYRGIPDVAGPAAYNFFYYDGGPAAGQGTSFATPLWAGMIAEMDAIHGSPFGFVTPHLYSIGAAEETGHAGLGLIDITSGTTCITNAGPGWDAATGWGSPRALALYQDLSGSFVSIALSVSSTSVIPGGSITASVTVLNSTSHRPIYGLNVTVALSSSNYVGPCGGTIQTNVLATDANGNASSSLTVPGCYLGSSVSVTATVSSGGYFGMNATTVAVNLIGLAGFLAAIQTFPYNVIAFAVIMLVAVVAGWRIGEWRRRSGRQRAQPPPAPPAAAPPPASPVSRPAPAPPPPPPPTGPPGAGAAAPVRGASAVPERPATALPPPNETPPAPVVPAHVLSPPSGPPPPAGSAAGSAAVGAVPPGAQGMGGFRYCASCGTPVPTGKRTCTMCGAALT